MLKGGKNIMLFCPHCGTKLNEEEKYCIKCGTQITDDIRSRLQEKKTFNKRWYLPIFIFAGLIISFISYYFILQHYMTQAKNLYIEGEQQILEEKYEEAQHLFQKSLAYKENFKQAQISLSFTNKALSIMAALEDIPTLIKNNDYEQALQIITDAENSLKNYQGPAVNELIHNLIEQRNDLNVEQINNTLKDDLSIDDLKIVLWEAEAIKNKEAEELTEQIRQQIIDYTFSKASDQLNKKHFKDALLLVEDGLKYAPQSDKLQSLQQTIDKEKIAFETAQQQRIEQAINMAAEEQELNENDAVKLDYVKLDYDEQGKLVVRGKVKSVATIPINSVFVEYKIVTKKGVDIVSNRVFAYPDRLYPDEEGQFEFTHYDLDDKRKDLEIEVDKITWYTD